MYVQLCFLFPYLGFRIAIFPHYVWQSSNVDENQTTSLLVLPMPANAFFIMGLA